MPDDQGNRDIHNGEDSNLLTDRFLVDHSKEPNVDPNTVSAFISLKNARKSVNMLDSLPFPAQ